MSTIIVTETPRGILGIGCDRIVEVAVKVDRDKGNKARYQSIVDDAGDSRLADEIDINKLLEGIF